MNIVPVILSGGSGTRLWPLSRMQNPKQFFPLLNDSSLFRDTLQRLEGLRNCLSPLVVCNEDHRFLVAEQLRELKVDPQAIVLEPIGRNTAPAVALAAHKAVQTHGDALLLVLPSDHRIESPEAFLRAVEAGIDQALDGGLVTFGITPERPETGFGYIQFEKETADSQGISPVVQFVEKPDRSTATEYLSSGEYLWNSGMFLFTASAFLGELQNFEAEIHEVTGQALSEAKEDLDFLRIDKNLFERSPSESIDYAVMERTRNAYVVPMSAGWSDLGSWSALFDAIESDVDGNSSVGDVLLHDCQNSFGYSSRRLVALLGVKDLVAVETADAILIADLEKVQEVKNIVELLKEEGRPEAFNHTKVPRPWGAYESLDIGGRYQVKRITVKPGARLSLQKHHHRAEHWVVVKGSALVTRGQEEILLTENQSTYIPLGEVHRLENPGKIALELIEVQTGSYLGEDDIVRLDDVYGRSPSKKEPK